MFEKHVSRVITKQSRVELHLTSGDSSFKITAPLVSTWITRAVGSDGFAMVMDVLDKFDGYMKTLGVVVEVRPSI